MSDHHTSGRDLLHKGERILGHTLAVVLGVILMISGLAMGVTMVLLPIGIPLGLGGPLLCIWGLFYAAPREQT